MKVLVDHMNFLFMSYHAARSILKNEHGKEELLAEDMGMFQHILFNKYHHLMKTYGNLIICHEGNGSLDWRRKIYNDYKRNRDASKQEQSYLDLKEQFPIVEKALEAYPVMQVKIDGMEADDVIYALSMHIASQGEEVTVISTDKDLIQLKNSYDIIDIYSPLRQEYYRVNKNIVMEKAICGDSSDNIPGLYRVGPKTFEKMLVDPDLWKKKMAGDNRKLYESFLQIVDLSRFPKSKHEEAVDYFEKNSYNQFNPNQAELFFYENGLQEHIMRWGDEAQEIADAVKVNIYQNTMEQGEKELRETKNFETEVDDFLQDFI